MPVIARFASCQLRLYPNDHPPPHFHVLLNDGREAWVTIEELRIVHGNVFPREIAEALNWAQQHRGELATRFEELQT